ncbi:MAG: AMP-binding protein, partial [Bacteroidota bacterium]|nr:AMP-binding protein [Bacteroidota bacterium]
MTLKQIPLHPAQREVYIDQLLDVGSPHYNVGGYIKLEGELDKQKFLKAVKASPVKFDAYRLRFVVDPDNFICFIDDSFDNLPVDELDFSGAAVPEKQALEWMQQRFNTAFNISDDKLLFEHCLLKLSDKEYWFYGKYHHLVTDGYGFTVWVQYLATKYTSLLDQTEPELTYPSYIDEAIKAADYSNSAAYKLEGEYWKSRISKKPAKTLERRYFQNKGNQKKSGSFVLNATDSQIVYLAELQSQTKVSLQQLTIAALIIYFGKTSSEVDFAFGIPLHKRVAKRLRNIVGMFSGIIPFKGTYDSGQLLSNFIRDISQLQRKDYGYQNYLIGDLSRNFEAIDFKDYLLDVVVNYQRLSFEPDFGKGVTSTVITLGSEYEVSPLQLIWREYGASRGLQLDVKYRYEYFKQDDIELLVNRLVYILEQFSTHLNLTISSIEIIPPAEKIKLLHEFNDTSVQIEGEQTLVDLFEQQVMRSPQKAAIKFGKDQLTYQQLNERSNQLAHYLVSEGVCKEMLVPVFIERGVDMMIAILGILKAGAAYVPIDVDYPVDRITFIIRDTCAPLVVVSENSRSKIEGLVPVRTVDTSVDKKNGIPVQTQNLSTVIKPDQLAYIIYTSGSTGLPKGVMIEHTSVVNLIEHQLKYFAIGEDEVILQFSNYTFDASVEQVFLSIRSGATLLLISKELQADQGALQEVIINEKVTHFHATPSFLETFPAYASGSLRRVIAGGEACSLTLAESWSRSVDFYNEYGPTETTVTITEYK